MGDDNSTQEQILEELRLQRKHREEKEAKEEAKEEAKMVAKAKQDFKDGENLKISYILSALTIFLLWLYNDDIADYLGYEWMRRDYWAPQIEWWEGWKP